MSKFYTLVAFVLLGMTASAQNTTAILKGKLIDSVNKQSLKDASVTILDARDSSLEKFGLVGADGSFSVTGIPFGAMVVQVKFNGYETFTKNITFSASNSNVNLGTVYLSPAANELTGVTVSQSVMRVKGDTTEFNASSFKTKPNAVAEDLIKKMPGMEVGKDGSIKSNGEAVARVLVDGKRFMGDDPKLATRNLPPDVIDKIQVFDDLSDQSKFSGFDDGNRVKTLNITTKKDKKKGMFGKAVAGIGSDDKYQESFNFTRMNGDQQITVMGQANNVNKQDFTINNIGGGRNFGGGGGGGGNFGGGGAGGGSGITTILSGGFNYRDIWSPKIDAYGSYTYNQPRVNTESSSNTQSILGNGVSTIKDAASVGQNKSENHRFSFNLEDRIDSMNSLIFRPNFALQSNNNVTNSSSSTMKNVNGVLTPQNKSISNGSSYNSGYNVNGSNLQLRHRFAKRGRTLSLDFNFSGSQNYGDGLTYTVNNVYGSNPRMDTLNQHYYDSSRSYSLNPTLSYTEPLGKNQMLEIRYSLSYNNTNSVTNTYRFDNASGKFSKFDSLYSNAYKFIQTYNTANLNYRFQHTKYNFSVGTGIQFQNMESNNTTKNVLVKRDFVNFTPNANFTYNFTKTRSLRVFYNGRTGTPSVSQLQPITTTTDSIDFQIGNGNLKPQFTNSLRVLYSSVDPFTQKIVVGTVNGTITTNDIVSSILQDTTAAGKGGRTTTYVNFGTTYNLNGYFMYGFPLKTPKSNINLSTNINYSKNQSLLSVNKTAAASPNVTTSYTLSETVKWTTNLKNNFDMNLSTTFSYNPIKNSSVNGVTTSNYMTHSLAADFTLYSNNGWTLASDFDYTHYYGRPAGYNTSIFLITPSIAKTFLKNKAGELRLSCFDLLNQNQAVSVSTNANQIVNSISNNLKRYLMLTFTYNLRAFGQQQRGQGPNQMRNMMFQGGQGGMMMGGFSGGGNGGGGRRGGNE